MFRGFKVIGFLFAEIIITLTLVVTINNYLGYDSNVIKSDAIGYYDYLPSIFIHQDFNRHKSPVTDDTDHLYERIKNTAGYVNYDSYMVNKYPCGTAILEFPFFLYAYVTTPLEKQLLDGYGKDFNEVVLISTLFYLFLSLIALRKLLLLYEVKYWIIISCQIVLVFATSVTNYASFDAGFSHVYSLFFVTLFMYFTRLFFLNKSSSIFYLACFTLGFIFILRNINILVIFFTPFLSGSYTNLIESIKVVLRKKLFIIGGIIIVLVSSLQFTAWYLQTGDFLVYSYQGESFDFTSPHIFDFLFSYKKGLFVYAPAMFIAAVGSLVYIFRKEYYLFISWASFFIILVYILSSWWSWDYGMGLGIRAMIDYYAIFIIPLAIVLTELQFLIKIMALILLALAIPLNMIQTYQYKNFILHWADMNKRDYWKVFLRTEDSFIGLLWKENSHDGKTLAKEIELGDFTVSENKWETVFQISADEIPKIRQVSIIQVLIDDSFTDTDNSKVIVNIEYPDRIHYWHDRYTIQFHSESFNKWHTGFYNYKFTPLNDTDAVISIGLVAKDQKKKFNNVRLRFYY